MSIAIQDLKLQINDKIKTFDFNGQIIEVKQYLPIEDKLSLITEVINNSQQEGINYINWPQVYMFITLGIIEYYTNIDLNGEDSFEAYDALMGIDNLVDKVYSHIPQAEIEDIRESVKEMIVEIKHYSTSALGVLDIISQDYSNTKFNVEELAAKLQNREAVRFLEEVMTKLG